MYREMGRRRVLVCRSMIVVCKTDDTHGCYAAFEAKGRKEATLVRKHLYRILPPEFRSSVRAFAETKQQHIKHGLTISEKIGYPIAPTKWFGTEDALPGGFEDLWYWCWPVWNTWKPGR